MKFTILIIVILTIIFLLFLLLANIIFDIYRKFANQNKKNKWVKFLLTCILFFSIIYYFVLYNPAKNFRTAYIEKSNEKYIITVKGRRNLMAHDPISLLKKGTYIDSAKFIIPRNEGIIKGNEFPQEEDSYKYLNNSGIVIEGNKLTVKLFYYNYDDKKNVAETWNGKYKLIKRE